MNKVIATKLLPSGRLIVMSLTLLIGITLVALWYTVPQVPEVILGVDASEQAEACEPLNPTEAQWSNIDEYDGFFAEAGEEFSFDPKILKAMSMIESGGVGHYDANGNVISGADNYGGCPAEGLMQVKPCLWNSVANEIGASIQDPEGNVRTAAKLMSDWTKDTGSWENAITQKYHPGTGQHGLTQSCYVVNVNELLTQMGAITGGDGGTPSPTSNPSHGQTGCVITKVGEPLVSPTIPPGCRGTSGGGNYRFPLESIDVVTGIATEMGSYAGGFIYDRHVEHAGLDIGTPPGQQVPVYAITDGTVIESRILGASRSCIEQNEGCNVTIQHDTDAFNSWYTHVDSHVTVDQKVKRGDVIGTVHVWADPVDNDHLHFELRQADNNYNINPRNYFPELQSVPVSEGYIGGVREYSASRGIHLLEDGNEWAEMFRDHPPCENKDPGWCWAM